MFDDLRQSGSFLDDDENPLENNGQATTNHSAYPGKERKFLGMTAAQRFVLSLVLLFLACSLGGLCLIIANRIHLPFF